MPNQRAIEMQELSKYFKMPEKAVAKHLGICLTSLKKICRANGIHRWPYRKIKSLDKKLRKLEHAMSTAKDDPSMAHAVSGYSMRSTDAAEASGASSPAPHVSEPFEGSGSSSPTPSASEASIASTPRQHEWSPMGSHASSSPRMSPVPQRSAAKAVEVKQEQTDGESRRVPIALNQPSGGNAIKLELSLSPDMLKQMAEGGRNITFVVQSVNGTTQLSPVISDAPAAAPAPAEEEMEQEPACKSPEPEPEHPDMAGMSDEDIIAMLADCASKPAPVKTESFSEAVQERSAAAQSQSTAQAPSVQLDPADAELMAALAGCCGGASPFEDQEDFDGQEECNDTNTFGNFDDALMMSLGGAFSNGIGAEDFLGIHA